MRYIKCKNYSKFYRVHKQPLVRYPDWNVISYICKLIPIAIFELCEGNLNYFPGIFVWLPKGENSHWTLIVKSNALCVCVFTTKAFFIHILFFHHEIHASSFSDTWAAAITTPSTFLLFIIHIKCFHHFRFHFINADQNMYL